LTTGAQGDTAQGIHIQHGVNGLPGDDRVCVLLVLVVYDVSAFSGAFFSFEISPILVVHTETRQSFAHFLTS
jgi:hypothetical protein